MTVVRVCRFVFFVSGATSILGNFWHEVDESVPSFCDLNTEACRPMTASVRDKLITTSSNWDADWMAEDRVPVERLQCIVHHINWNSFVYISDDESEFQDISKAFASSNVDVRTFSSTEALSQEWIGSVAVIGPSSTKHPINVVVSYSSTFVRLLLQQVNEFDADSMGQSVAWLTWRWLLLPRCGSYGSCDLTLSWLLMNTTMNNVAVLTPKLKLSHHGSNVTICSSVLTLVWKPRGQGRGREAELSGHFSTRDGKEVYQGHTDLDLFPHTKHGFCGRKLTFVTKAWSYLMFKKEENGKSTWQGSYMDMLHYLSRRLNFTFNMVESPDDTWGTVDSDGHWDGVLGMVSAGKAVVAWLPFEMIYSRAVYFDFPSPTQYSITSFIYQPPNSYDHLTLLLKPLSWQVLVGLAISVPVVTVMLYLVETVSMTLTRTTRHRSMALPASAILLHRCFEVTVGAVFLEASTDKWKHGASRLLICSWWLFSIVVASAYSGSLMAHLSAAERVLPIRTWTDLVRQTEYKWGVLGNASFHAVVMRNNLPLYRKIREGLVQFSKDDPTVTDPDDNVHYHKVLSEKYVFVGHVANMRTWQKKSCQLVLGQESLKQAISAPAFAKRSAYTTVFNDIMSELRDMGLLNEWNQRWMPGSQCQPVDQPRIVISLSHLQGLFYVTISALGLSALFLSIEICVGYFSHRK